MKRTLAISSLITLALLITAAAQENYFTEWRGFQRQYKKLLVSRAGSAAERELARRFAVELRQIVVPDLDAVDRCVSCHLGVDDPRMAGEAHPFKSHTGPLLEQHDAERFGCTACHGGQGRATTAREAHARSEDVFWERPLLPKPYLQATCGSCHDPAHVGTQGAPVLARGFEAFRARGCRGCHKLDGRGGSLGPALDAEGDKVRHALPFARVAGARTVWNWHSQHFREPAKVVEGSLMPKLRADEPELAGLTTCVMSFRSGSLIERLTPRDRYAERHRALYPSSNGADLYREFCSACHGEGLETLVHDTLKTGVPSIRNPDFLELVEEEALITNIQQGRPGTAMPAWAKSGGGLYDEEIVTLARWLLAGRQRRRTPAFAASERPDPGAGKRIFDDVCATCHAAAAGPADGPWLGSAVFQTTYSDALIGHNIKFGRTDTLMVPYGRERGGDLTDQQIADLVSYIRTLH